MKNRNPIVLIADELDPWRRRCRPHPLGTDLTALMAQPQHRGLVPSGLGEVPLIYPHDAVFIGVAGGAMNFSANPVCGLRPLASDLNTDKRGRTW